MTPNPMNPDCRAGKHQACAGDAWDETNDQPAQCTCPCHAHPTGTEVRGL